MSEALRRILSFLAILSTVLPAAGARRVMVLTEGDLGLPGSYGLGKLKEALRSSGADVVDGRSAGTADWIVLANVRSRCAELRQTPEALSIRRGAYSGKPAIILCGADPNGLMYAALDTADRVRSSGASNDPFQYVKDVAEKPYLAERAISIYTMQRAWFESRLYDEAYWRKCAQEARAEAGAMTSSGTQARNGRSCRSL